MVRSLSKNSNPSLSVSDERLLLARVDLVCLPYGKPLPSNGRYSVVSVELRSYGIRGRLGVNSECGDWRTSQIRKPKSGFVCHAFPYRTNMCKHYYPVVAWSKFPATVRYQICCSVLVAGF